MALASQEEVETHGGAAYTKLGALRSRSRDGRSVDEVGQLLRVLGLVYVVTCHCCKNRSFDKTLQSCPMPPF